MLKQEPLCNCRVCGHLFKMRDRKIVKHKLYGIIIDEKVCPKCGSCEYENILDRKYLDRYLNFANTDMN